MVWSLKVSFAVQVLSNSVAVALDTLEYYGYVADVSGTVNFLKVCDDKLRTF